MDNTSYGRIEHPADNEDDAWLDLRPPRPTSVREDFAPRLNTFLESVVLGSAYQPADIIAIGIGIKDPHFQDKNPRGEQLLAVYVTPKGNGEIAKGCTEPYKTLSDKTHPVGLQELSNGQKLDTILGAIGSNSRKTLIDWSRGHKEKRLLVIYTVSQEDRHRES